MSMIPGLDGLRALAFLALLCLHTGTGSFGWMGVQLFFVLSGFLITDILLQMKDSLPTKQYFIKFYGRRFLRIFPLYFAYLFILTITNRHSNWIPSTVLRSEIHTVVQPQLHYAYFYIYDFFHASSGFQTTRFLSHLWSLSVEEQFYIFWPLILFLTPREKIKHLFLFAIALAPIFRILIYLTYRSHLLSAPENSAYLAVYVLPFSHIDAFAMGAYISCFQIPNPRKQLLILAHALPLLGFLTQYLSVRQIQLNTMGYEFTLFTAYKFVWGYSVVNYFFALLIQAVTRTKLFTNILEHFILRYLGKISYGLYVYHYPIIGFILTFQLMYKTHIDLLLYLGNPRTYLIALLITVIISSISFHFFEKPINHLKDRLFPLKST